MGVRAGDLEPSSSLSCPWGHDSDDMAAKRKSWLGEWWRSLAALLLWAVGVVAAHAAPPLLPSLAETRVGGLQPSAEIIAPADLLLSLELHRACGPPLYDLASDCSVAAKSGTTKTTTVRPKPGADGGRSAITIEKDAAKKTISKTHTVTTDGKVVHQHQEHKGKYGGERRFPDSWTGTETISAPEHVPVRPKP